MGSGVPRKKKMVKQLAKMALKCPGLSTSINCSSGSNTCDLKYLTNIQAKTIESYYLYGSHGMDTNYNLCPSKATKWEDGCPAPWAQPVQVRPVTNKFLHDNTVFHNKKGDIVVAQEGFFRAWGNTAGAGCDPPSTSSKDWAMVYHWGPYPQNLTVGTGSAWSVCNQSSRIISGGVLQGTSSGRSARGILYMHCGGKSGYIPCVHTPAKTVQPGLGCSFKIVGPEADTSINGAWISGSYACTGCSEIVSGTAQSGGLLPGEATQPWWSYAGMPCSSSFKAPSEEYTHLRIGVYGSIGSGSFLNIYCSGSASGPANDGWGVLTGTFSGEDNALANADLDADGYNYYRKFFKIPTGSLPIQLSFTASAVEKTPKAGMQIYWTVDN